LAQAFFSKLDRKSLCCPTQCVMADDPHAKKRADILAKSLEFSNLPSWGYFGVPGPLAIGDNSYAPTLQKKPPPEDDGGGPLMNITTKPVKKGAGTDVYFRFETPLRDPYIDPHMVGRSGRVTMLDPDAPFRPPGGVKKSTNKLGYLYIPHCDTVKDPKEVREKYRDYMPPRNILTNAAKKGGGGVLTGGVLFGFGQAGAFPAHHPDDYDAPKKMRARELEEHRAKLQDTPFRGSAYGNKSFADNTETYNYGDVPTHIPREMEKADTVKRAVHEAPFRPSAPTKKGILHGTIGGIPEYIMDPVPGGAQRRAPEDPPPPAFKLGNLRQVTNPMPSVVTNIRNMRNERPSSFSRPML